MDLKNLAKENNVEGMLVLIEKRQELVTKSGKPYLALTVRDKTASIGGKLWDYKADKHGSVKEGSVVQIWATVDEFNGALQLNLKDISESLDDPTQFFKHTRFEVEAMWSDLVILIHSFKEEMTKFVAEEILLKHDVFIDAFKKAPAAKTVHNAWYGGLLEHVHSLVSIADPVINHYQKRYCKQISRDKVMFGLLMHDAGKIIEYDYNTPSFNPTAVGVFTNHMVIGPAWVYEKANQFMATAQDLYKASPAAMTRFKLERAHLMHVIAAHHGQIIWGSPVVPASIEAIIVHHLDNLDSKVMHALELVEGKTGNVPGFSERSYFEGTQFCQYNKET